MSNFYIADLHLFNKNQTDAGAVNHDGRPFATPEEMNAHFLHEWNSRITNGDTVHIAGDVAMRGRNEELIAFVAQLKGNKVLIRGNHDDLSDYRYRQLFAEICDYKEITDSFDGKTYKLCLMHYPILMWNGQHKGTILLYGHTHKSPEDSLFQQGINELNTNPKYAVPGGKRIRAFNIGCMQPHMGYAPRTLKEILQYFNT